MLDITSTHDFISKCLYRALVLRYQVEIYPIYCVSDCVTRLPNTLLWGLYLVFLPSQFRQKVGI
jgi:hypothetical protein